MSFLVLGHNLTTMPSIDWVAARTTSDMSACHGENPNGVLLLVTIFVAVSSSIMAVLLDRTLLRRTRQPHPPNQTPKQDTTSSDTNEKGPRCRSTPDSFDLESAVSHLHDWLLAQGGQHDVPSLIEAYCKVVRYLGVPLDRYFLGPTNPRVHSPIPTSAWKWQIGSGLERIVVPRQLFEKLRNQDEPFMQLHYQGRDNVRIQKGDSTVVPKDTRWFIRENYTDYLALPIRCNGREYRGAMAWATKAPEGFGKQQIEFLHRTLPALATVIRLHSNDLALNLLMSNLEEEVEKRTQELAAANARLEEANKRVVQQAALQLKHFAMLNHEIRTPLNCILGEASLLQIERAMSPEQREESIKMIAASGNLLRSVVDDILDFSKLDTAQMEINNSPMNVSEMLGEVVKTMSAHPKKVEIRASFSSEIPETIVSDKMRLQQILFNILGNAVKFSKANSYHPIEFEVTVHRSTSEVVAREMPHLQFRIKDYGIGIKKEHLDSIFEPFCQLKQETQTLYGGTGLGLPITAKILKVLHGEISVTSEFGEWCEFVVVLPYEEAPSPPASGNEVRLEETDQHLQTLAKSVGIVGHCRSAAVVSQDTLLTTVEPIPSVTRPVSNANASDGIKRSKHSNLKVLIAEDNPINQKILERMLVHLDIKHIAKVANGRQAVEKEAETAFDIIFMDISMPVMDGLEATRLIRKRQPLRGGSPSHGRPKIVFLTAHALDSYRAEAVHCGGDAFISKPYQMNEIHDILINVSTAEINNVHEE